MKRPKFNFRFVAGFSAGIILLIYGVATLMFIPSSVPRTVPGELISINQDDSSSGVPNPPAKAREEDSVSFSSTPDVAGHPFFVGETITYTIKSLKISVGKATLTFKGEEEINGRAVYCIVFRATGPNFLDVEEIFADREGLYPVMVRRNLNIWGKKEQITEEYDHRQGLVKITKHVGDKTEEQTIKKSGVLDNIYCFIYRYRHSGNFKLGDSLALNLPTQDIKISLNKRMKLKAAGKEYDSYYMMSDPAKYKVWFDSGDQKIPLRISGSVGLKNTDMVMTDYKAM